MTPVRSHREEWGWAGRALVLAAIPTALYRLTGNPVPSRWLSWDDLQTWWGTVQQYPSQALDIVPRLLVDALWIAWAWYALWYGTVLAWLALRLPATVLPRILLRLTPRTTVQAITVGAVAATPAVHTAHNTAPLPASLNGRLHLALDTPAPRTLRPGHPLALFAPKAANTTVHEVVTGDTLWNLAARHYGDGEQWHRIYRANLGHPQPDGAQLRDPDLIQPGWKLTIPAPGIPTPGTTAPSTTTGPTAPTRPTTPPTPDGNRAPAATAPDAAVGGPTAPASHPSPTGAATPGDPDASSFRSRRTAADPRVPHTVGWHLPGGGYIGITLIAAIASCVALLRTRQRLHPDTAPPIPGTATHLAAVHTAAKQAHAHGALPADYQDQAPPLYTPQPGLPTLGTYPDGTQEASYNPGVHNGPLVLDGPGASDAARALALSLLGATGLDDDLQPEENPLGLQILLTDRDLAAELFGATPDQHLPGWLHLTDTPAQAVAQFHTAARRRANAGIDAEDFLATDDDPYTALLLRADPALHDTITEACLTDPTGSLSALLLGPAPPDPHTTTLTLDQDGALTHATGPRAAQVNGLGIYHLPRERASELFHVLHATHAVYRQPPSDTTPPAPGPAPANDTAPEPEEAESTPQGPESDAPEQPTMSDPRTLTDTPLLLRILGPIDILGPDTTLPARGDRTRALLTLLTLHPDGLRATQLADLAWDQPFPSERQRKKAVFSALDRVRDLLRATTGSTATAANGSTKLIDPVPPDHAERYRLDTRQIITDLQLRARLEDHADHTSDPAERLRLLVQAAELQRGPLADGLDDNDRDWLTTARYDALQHTALLHVRIAELTADTDPPTALRHLNCAAPDDEPTTTIAIGLYHRLGRPELARALEQRLAA